MDIVLLDINEDTAKERFGIDGNFKTIESLDEVPNNKGDFLVSFVDNFVDLYNGLDYYDCDEFKYQKYDLYEFDRLNRELFSNYRKVFLISIEMWFKKYNFKSLYSNINFVDDGDELDLSIDDNKGKISNIKKGNILRLKDYVEKQDDYFDSERIMKEFNVSNRWVKRYMKDMNDIYNNIGYSYSKRKWYKVRK